LVQASLAKEAVSIVHRRVHTGRLELHVAELGEGPAVLLLHGFPAFWQDWEGQMRALAASGFRAIAVDLPGYGGSDRLQGVLDYRSSLLGDDLAGLIRALGLGSAHVIGHDWGGTLAYTLAAAHPELVGRLIIVNAAHPLSMQRALRHLEQLRKSWYVFFFQLPWLPEWLLQRRATIALCTRGMEVRSGAFSDEDVDRYSAAMRTPGVAQAALGYYRAAFRAPSRGPTAIPQRTLVLWGERDKALSAKLLLDDLHQLVPHLRISRFTNAGHWLHHDLPEVVNRHVIEFLSASEQPNGPNAPAAAES
jgi:pimeloyl-ACP methyl ester carboxylesterase